MALTQVKHDVRPLYGEYVRDQFGGGGRGPDAPHVEVEFRRRSAQSETWVSYFGGSEQLESGVTTLREAMREYRRNMW